MKYFARVLMLAIVFVFHVQSQTTWHLDTVHSNLDFSVRYMMLSNVRGAFTDFDAVLIQNGDDFSGSRVEVTVNTGSINTQNDNRDDHLRSDDFFDAENYTELTFISNEFKKVEGNNYRISGDLTIRGVTKPVEIEAELIGMIDDPRGMKRVAFSGETSVNRDDFGVQWNRALEAGGFVVGQTVNISINAQFLLES